MDSPPVLSAHDEPDHGLVYSEQNPESRLRYATSGITLPDFADLVGGEFGSAIRLASKESPVNVAEVPSASGSTLGLHVAVIVSEGPQEQMVRPHAGRIVATVKHRHPVRYRAIRETPRDAVSGRAHPSAVSPFVRLAVAPIAARARPQPAARGLVDVSPQASFDRFSLRGHGSYCRMGGDY